MAVRVTVTLPSHLAARKRNWVHFGAATPENCHSATTIGEEVFLEFAKGRQKLKELRETSRYVSLAYNCGYTFNMIKQIENADNPAECFHRFQQNEMSSVRARVLASFPDELERIATSQNEPQKQTFGLAARLMMMKKAAEEQAVATCDQHVSNGEIGFRARLLAAKRVKDESEHERTLFISNIPLEYTVDDVRAEVEALCPDVRVSRINLVKKAVKKNGPKESTGKVFVVCETIAEADELLEALVEQDVRWLYCIVSAQKAEPKES